MADSETTPVVVNVDELPATGTDEDGGRWTRLARAAGGSELGCTLEEVAPGGSPARYHYHTGNEEAMFVLSGRGRLRTPDGEHSIRAGDYAAFPVGEGGAHAVENTGEEPLRCLFLSTMNEPDVVVYPDDGEVRVVAGDLSGEVTVDREEPTVSG